MIIFEEKVVQKLYLTIGISGCGKSTFTKPLAMKEDAIIVNPDTIRKRLTGDVSDQSKNKEVFEIAYKEVDDALALGKSVIFDSTGLYPPLRLAMLEKAHANHAQAIAVIFQDSYDTDMCRARVKAALDAGEDRSNSLVNTDIIDRQFKGFIEAIKAVKTESWDVIQRV